MYWDTLLEKMTGKLREAILHMGLTVYVIFGSFMFQKSLQGSLEITNPVAWILLTRTAQAALHLFLLPSSTKKIHATRVVSGYHV